MKFLGVAGAVTAAGAVVVVLAGCHSSGGPATSPTTGRATVASAPPTLLTPPSSVAPPTSSLPSVPSVTARPPSKTGTLQPPSGASTPPSSPSAPGVAPCTGDQLSVQALPGGALPSQEIAGLIFTNNSSKTCALTGYPSLQLRYQGKDLGRLAAHVPGAVRQVVLRPNSSAEAKITASTTCEAHVSDHGRVRAPAVSTAVVVRLQLRGCSIRVGPVRRA